MTQRQQVLRHEGNKPQAGISACYSPNGSPPQAIISTAQIRTSYNICNPALSQLYVNGSQLGTVPTHSGRPSLASSLMRQRDTSLDSCTLQHPWRNNSERPVQDQHHLGILEANGTAYCGILGETIRCAFLRLMLVKELGHSAQFLDYADLLMTEDAAKRPEKNRFSHTAASLENSSQRIFETDASQLARPKHFKNNRFSHPAASPESPCAERS